MSPHSAGIQKVKRKIHKITFYGRLVKDRVPTWQGLLKTRTATSIKAVNKL